MKKANFTYNNQEYKGYIIIENKTDLKKYKKIQNILFIYEDWLKIINDGLTLVVNPMNGISYFCVPKTVNMEWL